MHQSHRLPQWHYMADRHRLLQLQHRMHLRLCPPPRLDTVRHGGEPRSDRGVAVGVAAASRLPGGVAHDVGVRADDRRDGERRVHREDVELGVVLFARDRRSERCREKNQSAMDVLATRMMRQPSEVIESKVRTVAPFLCC